MLFQHVWISEYFSVQGKMMMVTMRTTMVAMTKKKSRNRRGKGQKRRDLEKSMSVEKNGNVC